MLGSRADCTPRCRSAQHCAQLATALSHHVLVSEDAALAWIVRHCHGPARARDSKGKSLLHEAAARGLLKVLEWLLRQKEAPLNGKDTESGYSPLHRAAFHGHLRALVFLLGRGANPALVDNDGLTALDHLVWDRPLHVTFDPRAPLEPYLWGANSNYNLGLGTNTMRNTPDILDHFRKSGTFLASVCLGKFHTGFVSSSGTALTCGHGRGGRLGHGSETMQLVPAAVPLPAPCLALALGVDHTVFLCEGGAVLTCGLNTYHQLGHTPPPPLLLAPAPCTARGTKALGVAAARFHSLYWTTDGVFTWGLNAGQLGHIKGERTVIQPKLVASLSNREGGVSRVVTSDGAVVVLTGKGDVVALTEYSTRKLGQRQHNVAQLEVTGGELDWQVGEGGRLDNIDFKLVAGGGSPLTVFLLSTHGRISVWGENRENSFIPCLFSLSRELIVADISVHKAGLLVVGKGGEAWTGTHQQGRTARPGSKTTTRDLIKLKRLPHIHRAVMSISDAKGRNFCILQVAPNEALTVVPEVSPAQMTERMTSLLNEVSEQDTIHDVICQVGEKQFPAHSFVLASGSESLSKQLRYLENSMDEELVVQVEDVHPETFHLVLQFLYTKTCDIFMEGASASTLTIGVSEGEPEVLRVQGNPGQVSAFQVYKENKNRKKKASKGKTRADTESEARRMKSRCPLALLVEAGKNLGVYGLAKTADFFRVVDGLVVQKSSPPRLRIEFTFKNLPELQDVTIETEEGNEVMAHRCILVARSEYFAGMFSSGWAEATSFLKLPIPATIVEAILDFLYKDDCMAVVKSEDLDFVCNVLVVADQFLLIRLKEICECQLSKLLSLKNAAELLQFASSYLAVQLQDSCMQFICLNLPAMLEGQCLDLLEDEVFAQLDRFYRRSNPAFAERRLASMSGYPSKAEVEDEHRQEPVTEEELDEAAEQHAASQSRTKQRRHSSGEGGRAGRGSPRLRTVSSGAASGSSAEESDEDVEEAGNNMEKLSLLDFDIEEREEEGDVDAKSTPSPLQDRSYFANILSEQNISPVSEARSPETATSVGRPEKKVRLSQKDRKRLSLEVENKTKEPVSAPTSSKPGWLGWGAAPEKPLTNSLSLFEIMNMETKKTGDQTKASPIPTKQATAARSKTLSESERKPEKRPEKKTAWKKISLGDDIPIEKPSVSPTKVSNPWKNIPPTQNHEIKFKEVTKKEKMEQQDVSFVNIMQADAKEKENLTKITSKPLNITQIEERAIEDLLAFYNADGATDEVITVTRVQKGVMAAPVWKRVNK